MLSKFLGLSVVLLLSQNVWAETCIHSIKEGSQKLTWTGFKYTKKAPVSGTFDKISFEQSKGAESMADLLESITFKIDTRSVNSGNPARDSTLKKSIFSFLNVPNEISGKVKSATQLDMAVELMINEVTPIQMSLNAENGKLVSTGSLNLMAHGLKKSYDAVHLACKGLHTGDDGVSKTWSTVDIKIEADYEVKCSKGLIDSIKSWFS